MIAKAESAEKGQLHAQWEEIFKVVHSEKLGEMAAEFDHVHSVPTRPRRRCPELHHSARDPAALSHRCGGARDCKRGKTGMREASSSGG